MGLHYTVPDYLDQMWRFSKLHWRRGLYEFNWCNKNQLRGSRRGEPESFRQPGLSSFIQYFMYLTDSSDGLGTLLEDKKPKLFFGIYWQLTCSLLSYNSNCWNQVHSGLKSNLAVVSRFNYAYSVNARVLNFVNFPGKS